MKPMSNAAKTWITSVIVITSIIIGYADSKSHIRHLRSPNQRSIRADKISTYLSSEPLQLYSSQHEQIALKCDVHINSTNLIWLKDGQIVQTRPIEEKKRAPGSRFFVDYKGDILVDTVRLEDSGRWQCEAEDADGYVVTAKPIILTVLDPPRKPYLLIDNRILDPGNLFIPVKENAELSVSCVVDNGLPQPTLSWELTLGSLALLDAPEIPYQALNFTESAKETSQGARNDAHFGKVMRAHHNATITCHVHHMALKKPLNVSLLIDVQYTPSFAISREPDFGIIIKEGMDVSLKCDVDSNPKSAPIWKKDDQSPPVQQTPDGFLNFTSIRREHSGWYKCTTRHLLGKFSSIGYFLNVRYEPGDVTSEPDFDVGELSSTGRQVEVDLGGAVQLQCPAGTNGCWTRVNGDTGSLDPMGASQDLRLEQIVYQEAGEYKCVTASQESRRRLDSIRNYYTVQLSVTGRPVVSPPNQTLTAQHGQRVTLAVEFCANPPYTRVMWITNVRRLYPGDLHHGQYAHTITNTSTPNCYNAMLTLKSISTRDSGEYSFLVRSPSGVAESVFNVNVTEASGYSISAGVTLDLKINFLNAIFCILIFVNQLF